MMTTTQLLSTLFGISVIICLVLIFLLSKLRKEYHSFRDNVTPYEHWHCLSNGSYGIPLTCKLYIRDPNGLRCIGTVANNLEDFGSYNLEEILEDYFYGHNLERKIIPIRVMSIEVRSSIVGIISETGKQFFIIGNENEDFPKSLKIRMERMDE